MLRRRKSNEEQALIARQAEEDAIEPEWVFTMNK